MEEIPDISPQPVRTEKIPTKERLFGAITELSETTGYKVLALAQIPVYLDLVRQNLQEGWPAYASILHPIINMVPGAIDPRFTDTINAEQFRYALEQGEIRTVGAVVVVGGIVGWFERRAKGQRGEVPITSADSLLYLNIDGLPVAFSFAQEIIKRSKTSHGNLVYAALFGQDQPRPDKKPHAGFRRWYAEQVNLGMNVTDTDVLRRTGALRAPCVIIAGADQDVIRINALSIQNWRNESGLAPTKIIPLPTVPFETDSPITFTDPDTGETVEIADKPVNPYRYLRDRLKDLISSDQTVRGEAISFFTAGVPESRKAKRQQDVTKKISSLLANESGKTVKIYFNGDKGDEDSLLQKFIPEEGILAIVEDAREADIILTYGESSVTGDIKINEFADRIKSNEAMKGKIHLFLTFSQGNEDNASLSAEGGVSLQRIIAREVTERTLPYVRPKLTPGQVVRMAVNRSIGGLIRNRIKS